MGSPRSPTSPRWCGSSSRPAPGRCNAGSDEKLDRFAESMGREPTVRERWQLEREAVLDSRPAKPKALDAEVLHRRWVDQTVALGLDPAELVAGAVGQVPAQASGSTGRSASGIEDRAMATIAEGQSTWRPAELVRELAAAVPTTTGLDADRLVAWLDDVAAGVAVSRCVDLSRPVPPGALLRRDGRPVTESAIDRALTTQAIFDQEAALLGWADRRTLHVRRPPPRRPHPCRPAVEPGAGRGGRRGGRLGRSGADRGAGRDRQDHRPHPGRRAAAGRRAGGVRGRPLGHRRRRPHRRDRVSPPTPSTSSSIEHRLHRPPDHRYDLPVGATVIVDEAGMIPTARLAELADLADVRGWRIVLVGDPLQFSAVGRGGMFGLLVDTFDAIELDRVHRFTHRWERDATLRLGHGDPDIADLYEEHGRLHGGTPDAMERAAVKAWWSHRQAGETVALAGPHQRDRRPAQPARPAAACAGRRARPRRPQRRPGRGAAVRGG